MKRPIAVAVLALFGLAPAVGAACEYNQAMASSTPAEQLGLAPAPAASKPAPVVAAKAPIAKAQKQTVATDKAPAPAQDKVAAVAGR